jgi:hypothetical protein
MFKISGTDQNDNPTVYDVTLVAVSQDAAPDNSFDAAPAGQHLVSAEFKITGISGASTDDANSDASINGANQQVYQPTFTGLAAGTNFDSGQFTVSPGQTEIGYVAFQLPNGVAASSVVWSPGLGGASGTWTVG